jgi:hypothetical protein
VGACDLCVVKKQVFLGKIWGGGGSVGEICAVTDPEGLDDKEKYGGECTMTPVLAEQKITARPPFAIMETGN